MSLHYDLHLILHKVRGRPALDVAMPVTLNTPDKEKAWIIPSSGHRAYPWHAFPIYATVDNEGCIGLGLNIDTVMEPLPPDLRDHFEPAGPKPTIKSKDTTTTAIELLARIGLYQPEPEAPPPLKRRI